MMVKFKDESLSVMSASIVYTDACVCNVCVYIYAKTDSPGKDSSYEQNMENVH